MHDDSIDALLRRHYGDAAPVPDDLSQRLLANLRRSPAVAQRQKQAERLSQRRMNRREALRLAFRGAGNAGIGLLSAGLEGLQKLEVTLNAQDVPAAHPARS